MIEQRLWPRSTAFVTVVGRDRLRDLGRFAVLAHELGADLGVGAFLLVIDRLADVVEQARAARQLDVGAELRGDQPGEISNLDGVEQHVLRIRLPELEPAQQLDQVGVYTVKPEVEYGLLARFLADL